MNVTIHFVVNPDTGLIESVQDHSANYILNAEQVKDAYNTLLQFSKTHKSLAKENIGYQKRINILKETLVDMQDKIDQTNTMISHCVQESIHTYSESIVDQYSREHSEKLKLVLEQMRDLERQYTVSSMSGKSKSTKEVGAEGEEYIIQKVQQLYPNWSIQDTHGKAEAGDFHSFLSTEEQPFGLDESESDSESWILNEVKTHKSSVRTAEVKKFYRDIDKHKPPMAIMYSLYSNIVGKPHGHYEKRNNTHIYFISYVMSNPQCLEFVHKTIVRQWKETVHVPTKKSEDTVDNTNDKTNTEETHQKRINELMTINKSKHVELSRCIEYMLSRDQILVAQYKKEINQLTLQMKQKKNMIMDTERQIREYTKRQFELDHYKNKNPDTNEKEPYCCCRCDILFNTEKQLLRHLKSNKHMGF